MRWRSTKSKRGCEVVIGRGVVGGLVGGLVGVSLGLACVGLGLGRLGAKGGLAVFCCSSSILFSSSISCNKTCSKLSVVVIGVTVTVTPSSSNSWGTSGRLLTTFWKA